MDNHVLTLAEVLVLEDGAEVWVETGRTHKWCDPSCVHWVMRGDKRTDPEKYVLELTDLDGRYWGIEEQERDYGKMFRVWSFPQPPTREERAANPWTYEVAK